ncbi:hypothetical protein [Methanobacterium formicicum]|uniref:hypothetical protein n=1 Tax=Methanobacterium formicicum TaxID=2162 RepID=UPI002412A94D|nr:hypothetical protein [Methanobacterium formicicum]MDG3547270.1 hypothetical protein [Methanobacterium formicicum]
MKYKEEGRILLAEFDDFILLNIYFPSGANSDKKYPGQMLHHKLMFYDRFLNLTEFLSSSGENLLISF